MYSLQCDSCASVRRQSLSLDLFEFGQIQWLLWIINYGRKDAMPALGVAPDSWRPLLPASSKTIMMERLQRPWDYHMRALEDQMPHEGREKPRSHRQQACEWRSCPGRSLPAQPLPNFPASWPWWVKWKDCFKPPCFGVVGYTAIDNCNSEEKEAIGRFWAIIWSDLSFIRIPLGLCWEQNENEERECGKETNLQSR